MRDGHHEILARIDERTRNIERRQSEEISRMDKVYDRISALETFKNFMVGAWAIASFLVAAGFHYLETKFIEHNGR